jgi:hypothetical protein
MWLGSLNDLNPHGKANPGFRADLKERYQFQVIPNSLYEAIKTTQLASFEAGVYTTKRKEQISMSVSLATGGIIADCRSSTADADEFLEDLLVWACEKYGLEDYRSILRSKVYISTIHCSLNKPLDSLNPKLSAFAALVAKRVPGFENMNFETGVVHIWPNMAVTPRPATPFRIERQEGTKPEDKRFFSQAPVPTDAHLELISAFEELL